MQMRIVEANSATSTQVIDACIYWAVKKKLIEGSVQVAMIFCDVQIQFPISRTTIAELAENPGEHRQRIDTERANDRARFERLNLLLRQSMAMPVVVRRPRPKARPY